MTTILDLFSGTGVGVAARQLGLTDLGVDNWQPVIDTREANGMTTIFRDVWDGLIGKYDIPEHDILWASPPCQSYSIAGKGAGRAALNQVLELIDNGLYRHHESLQHFGAEHDERTALVLSPLAYIADYRPRAIALEQVPPVMPVWQAYASVLEGWGYSVATGPLQAEQYGVPQTRRRAILVARRDGVPAHLPVPTHSRYYSRNPEKLDPGVRKWVSMADALSGAHSLGAERALGDWKLLSTYSTDGDYTNRGEREQYEPAPTVTTHANRNKWIFNDQSGSPYDPEWPEKRPATVIAGRGLVQNPGATANRFNGSTKSRNDGVNISYQDAAVLQTYPADFAWKGKKGEVFTMIGNAVPVKLAEAVLETLLP